MITDNDIEILDEKTECEFCGKTEDCISVMGGYIACVNCIIDHLQTGHVIEG
jgi:hypothetical protein